MRSIRLGSAQPDTKSVGSDGQILMTGHNAPRAGIAAALRCDDGLDAVVALLFASLVAGEATADLQQLRFQGGSYAAPARLGFTL